MLVSHRPTDIITCEGNELLALFCVMRASGRVLPRPMERVPGQTSLPYEVGSVSLSVSGVLQFKAVFPHGHLWEPPFSNV